MSCRYLEGVWKGLKGIFRCIESVLKVSEKHLEGIKSGKVKSGQVKLGLVKLGEIKLGGVKLG